MHLVGCLHILSSWCAQPTCLIVSNSEQTSMIRESSRPEVCTKQLHKLALQPRKIHQPAWYARTEAQSLHQLAGHACGHSSKEAKHPATSLTSKQNSLTWKHIIKEVVHQTYNNKLSRQRWRVQQTSLVTSPSNSEGYISQLHKLAQKHSKIKPTSLKYLQVSISALKGEQTRSLS